MLAYRALYALPLLLPLSLGCSQEDGDGDGGDDGGQAGSLFEITSGGQLSLSEDALEQPLLLTRTVRNGPSDAGYDAWLPLTSKVVYFRADGDAVELREIQSASGEPGDGDPVLASFDGEQADGGVSVDYGKGMSVVHLAFAVYERHDPAPELELPILQQTVERAEVTGDHLIVEREAVVELGEQEAPARIQEAFEPYQPPAGFEGRVNAPILGFYENPPLGEESFIHRHDASAPITFHVSTNTPPARRADLEVAVAYWNRLFEQVTGEAERIRLDDLPEGVDDFEPGYSIIRWLEELSGGGRGVNHTDPFTGRILRSTIHVSPIFEVAGADATSIAWQRMLADRGQSVSPPSQELIERVVSDYYVNAYVHELGHGLGLRHQFAGNLGGNVASDEADGVIADYLTEDRDDERWWTSSVMEYVPILQAAMVGDAVRAGEALPYDVDAIRFGYGEPGETPEFGAYCEAELADAFADCRENDIGADSIAGTYWAWEDRLEEIAFRNAAAAAAGEPLSDPAIDAMIVATLFGEVAAQFVQGADFLAVKADFPDPVPEGEQGNYEAAVVEHQLAGYATSEGTYSGFLDQVVTAGPQEAATAELVAQLRTRTEELAAALDAEVDGGALDTWAASLTAALPPLLAPLAELTFIDLAR